MRWLAAPPARTAYFSSARSSGVVLRVSSTVMRPSAASTNWRASVAVPVSRCTKLRAVRSAVSRPAAWPRNSATTSPGSQRSPSQRSRRISTPASHCRNASHATSRPARTHGRLGDEHRRRPLPRLHCGRRRHVAAPDVFGQRLPDQVAIGVRGERLRRPGHAPGSPAFTALSSANTSSGPATSAKRKSRMCAAAWKSRAAGPSPASGGRQHRALDDRLHRPLLHRLDAANVGQRGLRLHRHLHRGIVVAADRRHHFGRRRPRGAVHAAGPPPRPHLLGDKRQVRREEPQQRREGHEHRAVGARRGGPDRSRRSGAT